MDESVGAGCNVLGQAQRGLTVGFLLLWYLVVYTAESLSLFVSFSTALLINA